MKQRELNEFAEVCAKEAEQKKESEQESKYVYNGEYQSAIKRIAAYLTGDSSEDLEYSSMEIIAKKLLDRVEGGSTEAFASPMDAIAWVIENRAIDAPTEGE